MWAPDTGHLPSFETRYGRRSPTITLLRMRPECASRNHPNYSPNTKIIVALPRFFISGARDSLFLALR
jgi:hypothetical protein